jgi:hypothetical protein
MSVYIRELNLEDHLQEPHNITADVDVSQMVTISATENTKPVFTGDVPLCPDANECLRSSVWCRCCEYYVRDLAL